MSYNVMIILEDYVKDQYIAKPLVERIMADMGKPRTKVLVCKDPRFTGISDCMNLDNLLHKVVLVYDQIHLFLLMVDRDKEETRHLRLQRLEENIKPNLKQHQRFLGIQAFQEVEVWALAGHRLPSNWNWRDIRDERDSKERYFVPFSKEKGYLDYPAQGRKKLMEESMQNWPRIKQLCPEDIGLLIRRIEELSTTG